VSMTPEIERVRRNQEQLSAGMNCVSRKFGTVLLYLSCVCLFKRSSLSTQMYWALSWSLRHKDG
ncbi:NEBL isoform 12, partial [Pan troglodytes]